MPNNIPPKRPFKKSGPKRPFSKGPGFKSHGKPDFRKDSRGDDGSPRNFEKRDRFKKEGRDNYKSGEKPSYKKEGYSSQSYDKKPRYNSEGESNFSRGKSNFGGGNKPRFRPEGRSEFNSERRSRFGNDSRVNKPRRSFAERRLQAEKLTGEIQNTQVDEEIDFPGYIKKYAKLKTEKFRLQESKFLIEGPKLIADIIEISPSIFADVLISETFTDNSFLQLIKRQRVLHRIVPQKELDHLSDVQSPQGVIGVAHFSTPRPNWSTARFATLLDGVQDPGNIGAIFRSSLALGMDTVILGKGCCEVHNPKVVRASASAFLRISFEAGVDLSAKIKFLRQQGFTIVGTSPHSSVTLDTIKLKRKVALVLGNEGAGLNEKIASQCDELVKIPQVKEMESLNVAVAHGILTHSLINLKH